MPLRFARPVLAVLLLAAAACSGAEDQAAPASTPANAPRVDEATAGAIVGRVAFQGDAPVNPTIKMAADPLCAQSGEMTFENYVVKDGGLDNVFVYVKDGLGDYYFETPTDAVTLDQKGCHYTPHVFGVRVGQPLEIVNSDPTLHNVNAMAKVNQAFNLSLPQVEHRSLNGFILEELGYVPEQGESIERDGIQIDILEATETQVFRARIRKLSSGAVRGNEG